MLYEKNTIIKNHKHIDVHFGLCYPNIYQTAMSSLGYNILYNQINEREDTWCERIIYPNEKSIESNTSSKYFDILSFTLQFEEDYFNVLERIGGGDAFDAGVLHALLKNDKNLEEALSFGAACFVLKHTVKGDVLSMSESEICSYLNNVSKDVKR